MNRFRSLTSPKVFHDIHNLLVEFICLNEDPNIPPYAWKTTCAKKWGKNLACVKKLTREPFCLDVEQIAFYIYKCNPIDVTGKEFGKLAVVAKKLFQKFSIEELYIIYQKRIELIKSSQIEYKKIESKSIMELIKELENGKK